MKENLVISDSPHLGSPVKTRNLMIDVVVALVPAIIASGLLFGVRALILIAVTVGASVGAEYVSRLLMKRSQTIGDWSAVVTGTLLAFNYPANLPFWMAALGGVIAIILVKQLFGGIGFNFVNPALTARIILMVSFPIVMTNWMPTTFNSISDAVSAATSLTLMREGSAEYLPSYLDMFLGNQSGSLGETCILALILGGVYLVVKRVISPIIPVTYISTVFIFSILFGQNPISQILSGGLFLGAIFMATDYTTSPLTNKGKVIYGVGCGVLTIIIRFLGSLPEGVSFSIIIMNILVPHIESITLPTTFGFKGGEK